MSDAFDPYYEWLGIPPAEQPPDYYRLLGIERFEHDPDVITASADRQTAFVRGLQQGQRAEIAQRLLAELAVARTCLLDPARRADYDSMLRSRSDFGSTANRRMARPAPRSDVPPPGMGPPPDSPVPPSSTFGTGAAGEGWPPTATGPAQVPGGPMPGPNYGASPVPPPGYAGMPGGPTPAYGSPAPPSLPPQSVPPPGPPPQRPPVGPPASMPASGPPPASSGSLPRISTGSDARIPTRAGETSPSDNERPEQRQVWLLLAIVGVVVVGAGLALLVVALGIMSPRSETGDGSDSETVDPMIGTLVVQQPDGSIHFTAADAVIHGETASPGTVAGRSVVTNWRSQQDWLAWDFRVERPAMFHVELVYAASAGHGGKFSVAIGDTVKEAAVRDSGGSDTFAPHEVGYMTVRRAGRYQLQLRAIEKPAGQLMDLRAIRLTPYDIGYVR